MKLSALSSRFIPFSLGSANRVLICLLVLDTVFIAIHAFAVIADYERLDYPLLYVDSDRSLGEAFQYVKFVFLILGCLYLIFKKHYGYIPWCLLFTAMLLDDSSEYHETVGEWIAVQFNFEPLFGLRAVDLGELCYAAGFGLTMLVIFFFFYRKGSQRFKNSFKDLALLMLIFVGFAVGVDMIHSLALENPPVAKILALLEDGGEMVAISLNVWYFAFMIGKGDQERTYLFSLLDKNGYGKRSIH